MVGKLKDVQGVIDEVFLMLITRQTPSVHETALWHCVGGSVAYLPPVDVNCYDALSEKSRKSHDTRRTVPQ